MNDASDFLERLVRTLEECGVRFMISGSFASSFHGEPRATRDIDLVIDCSEAQLRALMRAAPRLDWYVNEDAAVAALRDRTMFNIIESSSGWKADLIVRKSRPFSEAEFERRVTVPALGSDSPAVPVASPEDTILSKLEWARETDSEQQYRDALQVAAVGGDAIDREYLRQWAVELGVAEMLESLLSEADERQAPDE